jgi:outer membrane protein assembly factor BamB
MLSLIVSILVLINRAAIPSADIVIHDYGQQQPQLPVSVELMYPPAGQMYVEDLWRVRLYNSSSEVFSVYLFVTIELAGAGLLMDATTATFLLPPGILVLSSTELSPISTEFYDSNFEESVSLMGGFPDGVYTVTIYVYEDGGGLLGSTGFTQDVKNFTAPELQYPADNTESSEPLPLFTWFPAFPPGEVEYSIRIVNILDGQSPESSISANPAWFHAEHLVMEEMLYPVYANCLEYGERYAWQVEGFYAGNSIGKSDIWSFTCVTPRTAADEGSEIWSFETGDKVQCSPAIALDGSIICGSHDGFLYSLDPGGRELWRYPAGGPVYAVAIGPDGRIFAAGDFGISCLDPSGFLVWHSGITGPVEACPLILPSGKLFAGSVEGMFFSLDVNSGDILDSLDAGRRIYLPASADSSGRVFLGCDRSFRALGEEGLDEVWSYRADDNLSGGPVIAGDYIYFCAGRDVFRFSPDGSPSWNTVLPSQVYTGPIVSAEGIIYTGTGSGNIYALEAETGSRAGVIPAGAIVTTAPAINVTGSLFFGCDDGYLYCFSPSGFSLWEFETGGAVRSSPVIGIDGTVYFGSDDHRIYAVAGSGAGPMTDGWPQYCRNSFNNGYIESSGDPE